MAANLVSPISISSFFVGRGAAFDKPVRVRNSSPTLPGIPVRETVQPQTEQGLWTWVCETVFGADSSDEYYRANFEIVKKLDDISDPEEREKALEENAKNICDLAEQLFNKINENIATGKKQYTDLTENIGVPMSAEQCLYVGGYSPEDQFYYNVLAYAYGKAVLENKKLFASMDMDGTLTDKSLRPFATRLLQPIKQIFQNRMALNAGIDFLDTQIMINTARSLVQTAILAKL